MPSVSSSVLHRDLFLPPRSFASPRRPPFLSTAFDGFSSEATSPFFLISNSTSFHPLPASRRVFLSHCIGSYDTHLERCRDGGRRLHGGCDTHDEAPGRGSGAWHAHMDLSFASQGHGTRSGRREGHGCARGLDPVWRNGEFPTRSSNPKGSRRRLGGPKPASPAST